MMIKASKTKNLILVKKETKTKGFCQTRKILNFIRNSRQSVQDSYKIKTQKF